MRTQDQLVLLLALALAPLAACGGAPPVRSSPTFVTAWLELPAEESAGAQQHPEPRLELELPYLHPGDLVLGAPVGDLRRELVGTVADLELDPRSGRVLAVSVELSTAPADAHASILIPGREFLWSVREGAPVVTVARPAAGADAAEASWRARSETNGEQRELSGAITELAPPDEPTGALVVHVRDDANGHHRVLLAPAAALEQLGLALTVGAPLTVSGVSTRDAKGRLLVAHEVAAGSVEVELRDRDGAPTWPTPPLAAPAARVSILDLYRDGLTAPDGSPLALRGFVLDAAAGRVALLAVEQDGVERYVCWSPLHQGAGGRHYMEELVSPDSPSPAP